MADILFRGEFLRGSRGFTFGDSTGVTWTFDSATNKLTLAITAGAVGSFDEAVDDRVAALLTDSTSVDFTYNDGANTLTAAVICANPTASIGLTAVNGTAATPMRSDAAPALDQGIAPTWTATHTWTDNDEVRLGTGGDLRLYHDGTNSNIRNDTGDLNFRFGASARLALVIASTGALTFGNTTDNADATFSGTGMLYTPGAVRVQNLAAALLTNIAQPAIYSADGTGSAPFNAAGALIIQSRSSAARDILFYTGSTTPTLRAAFIGSGGFRVDTTIGFNGTTPISKPAVTGSRGGNAALASLLTALANYGLLTDSSSA